MHLDKYFKSYVLISYTFYFHLSDAYFIKIFVKVVVASEFMKMCLYTVLYILYCTLSVAHFQSETS